MKNRKPEVKAGILHVAMGHFARFGYDRTSTRDICTEMGLAHSALYNYFASKEEILYQLVVDAMTKSNNQLRGINCEHAHESALARLRLFVRATAMNAMNERRIWNVLQDSPRDLSGKRREAVVKLRDEFEERIRMVLDEAVQAGEIAPKDTWLATAHIVRIMTGPAQWYRPRGRLKAAEIARDTEEFVLAALRRSEAD
jgi:AcrR family transcriptional regulator